jgi:pimeloyl-ACP methyl ester carboxylesterase
LASYFVATHQHNGVLEGASLLGFKYKGVAKHPLVFEDRLGNKELDFAIGASFGDRDWLYSEDAAEPIIKGNKYFSSGESQLFLVPNSGHMIFLDNPRELERQLIGFFTGKLKGTFDPKSQDSYIAKL